MSKTISCRLDSEMHEKLLNKCNETGLTVNDFVKVLVQSALVNFNRGFEPTNKSVDQSPDSLPRIENIGTILS